MSNERNEFNLQKPLNMRDLEDMKNHRDVVIKH